MAYNTHGLSDISMALNNGSPIPFHWGGWHSNSHELRRRGWEIFAEEQTDLYAGQRTVRVAAKAPDRKLVITGSVNLEIHHMHLANYAMEAMYTMREPYNYMGQMKAAGIETPMLQRAFDVIDMQYYTAQDRYMHVDHHFIGQMNNLRPIEAYSMPSFDVRGMDTKTHPKDLKIFSYIEDTEKIYIPSEDQLLDKLLQMQYPLQQEIKKKLVLPESKPIIKAQIFTLAA